MKNIKNIRKAIFILIIILIFVLFALLSLIKNKQKEVNPNKTNIDSANNMTNSTSINSMEGVNNNLIDTNRTIEDLVEDGNPQDSIVERKSFISKETSEYIFFSIDDNINQFFTYIKKDQKEEALNLLRERNTTNIDKVSRNISKWYSQEMYKYEGNNNFVYFVRGFIVNEKETNFTEYHIEFTIDYSNETFDMLFLSKQEYEQKVTSSDRNHIQEREISKNEYNSYKENTMSSQEFCERYIKDFIFKLKYNVDLAYDLLDEEWRKNKFNDNIESFKEYVNQNKEILYNIKMQDYKKEINKDSILLIIKGQNNDIYKIKRTNLMEYTIVIE